jgi:uncharacterized metal-binding protein
MARIVTRNAFDGREHERRALAVLAALLPACIGLFVAMPDSILMAELVVGLLLGGVCGWWITPDIDHRWMTMEEYRALRLDALLGRLWILAWRPYSLLFGHRSRWTHSWRGTLLRALPFMLGIAGFWMFVRYELVLTSRILSPFYLGFLGGWLIQDMVHYHHDGLGWRGVEK